MFKALLNIWADAQGHWFPNDDGRQGDFERYHYMRVKPCPCCKGEGVKVLGELSSKCVEYGCVDGCVIDTEGVSDESVS